MEDEERLARALQRGLGAEGYVVDVASDGVAGLEAARHGEYDAVVLDIMLPRLSGYRIVQALRDESNWVPVLMLSAKDGEYDQADGLDAGADDYLTKPFGVSELRARMRAQLRRRNQGGASESPKVSFGGVTVDLALRQVWRDGEIVHLTPLEYRLLATLVRHAGRVLTHRQLLRDVWGPSHVESHHYLRIYMAHLRQKLERDPAQPEHIVTETGVGYRLVGAA